MKIKLSRRLFTHLVFFTVLGLVWLCLATTAWAQTADAATAPTLILQPAVLVTTLLSIVLGFVNQGINTGSVLGIVTVPKPWLPYLTIFLSFGSAFAASLASSGVLTGAALLTAVISGFTALLGSAGGSAVLNHLKAHKTSLGEAATSSADKTEQKAA